MPWSNNRPLLPSRQEQQLNPQRQPQLLASPRSVGPELIKPRRLQPMRSIRRLQPMRSFRRLQPMRSQRCLQLMTSCRHQQQFQLSIASRKRGPSSNSWDRVQCVAAASIKFPRQHLRTLGALAKRRSM
jgi:hypothetical protein